MLVIAYPGIDPVLVSIGPFPIRWYALAYIGGLVGGWAGARYLAARDRLWGTRAHASVSSIDDLVAYVAMGIIGGGRLGYVLFYNPGHYLAHPLDIPVLWHGGMSFHGGLVGTILAMAVFARRNGLALDSIGDMVAAPKLRLDEVGEPAEAKADRHHRRHHVADAVEREAVAAGEHRYGEDRDHQTDVERQTRPGRWCSPASTPCPATLRSSTRRGWRAWRCSSCYGS